MTALAVLLRAATPAERVRLAALAGTTVNYLYQVAGCHRQEPSAAFAFALEDASRVLAQETGRPMLITARQIATMCAIVDLPEG